MVPVLAVRPLLLNLLRWPADAVAGAFADAIVIAVVVVAAVVVFNYVRRWR